jgi:ornithine--oxo-acid transaminase
MIPEDGYYKEVSALCKKHNVLCIADEVQTGLGRTGYMLAVEHENIRPGMEYSSIHFSIQLIY